MIEIRICAVPERTAMVLSLKSQLLDQGVKDVRVIWDTEHKGSWWSLKEAMKIPTRADTLVLLEDDVVLCDNFGRLAQEATEAKPDDHILFYTGYGYHDRYEAASKKHLSWYRVLRGGTSQAMAIPSKDLLPILKWNDANLAFTKRNRDMHVSIWRTINLKPHWVTVPELVKHIGKSSAVHTGNNKKEGALFIKDINTIDWSSGIKGELTYCTVNDVAIRFLERYALNRKVIDTYQSKLEELRRRLTDGE